MRVYEATKLTCSAGIAPNRMLAKICSDWNKPNGQAYISANRLEILDFVGKLDIRKIPYIGAMTETTLKELGILKGKDLVEKAHDLMIAYREIMYTFLIKCGLGIGQQVHHEEKSDETFVQKGIGISLTFGKLTTKDQF
jgi:DNA polymerase kappa